MGAVVLLVRPIIDECPSVEDDPRYIDLRIRIDRADLERRIKETKRSLLPNSTMEIVLRPTPGPKGDLTLYNVTARFR